jgi:hypothetical protein
MSKEMGRAWEQLAGESRQAWEAFRAYRDMGDERSLDKVGEGLGKSRGLIGRWSAGMKWRERILAYERELDRERQKIRIKDIREEHKRSTQIIRVAKSKLVDSLNTMTVSQISIGEWAAALERVLRLERMYFADDLVTINSEPDGTPSSDSGEEISQSDADAEEEEWASKEKAWQEK